MFALAVLLLVSAARAQIDNCRAPGDYAPGTVAQCDMATDCVWCERNHLSFDFLCCETGNWIGAHLVNPMSFYLVTNDARLTIIVVAVFELFEVFVLVVFGAFQPFFAADGDFETIAASFIGDVLIQGGLGLLAGYAIRVLWLAPTLLSSVARARAYDARGRRFVYFVVYALFVATFLLPGLETSSGTRWGLWVQLPLLLVFVWLVWPLALTSELDRKMIWQQLDGSHYDGWRKAGFFATWGVTIVVAYAGHLASGQPTFAINEWYQQWLLSGPWVALLVIAAIVVSAMRRDGYTALVLVGSLLMAAFFALWFAYAIVGSTTTLVFGIVAAIVAAVVFFVGAWLAWPDTRVPTDATMHYDAAQVTRKAARTIKDAGAAPLLTEEAAAAPSVRQRVPFTLDFSD